MSAFTRWLVSKGYVSSEDTDIIMAELSANNVEVLYCKFIEQE